MKVLVTGADGFIGKNLILHLKNIGVEKIIKFTIDNTFAELDNAAAQVDFIFHLAGINRPKNPKEFEEGNVNLTQNLINSVKKTGKNIPIVFSSSIQATHNNPYGQSKLEAEKLLLEFANDKQKVFIYRLPNVFGKWAEPNYNSVVATFCYNYSHNLPIKIHDPSAKIQLVYIDDVINNFIQLLNNPNNKPTVDPVYNSTVGEIANIISSFAENENSPVVQNVGNGFKRALYSTFLSYFEPDNFVQALSVNTDDRGLFSELIQTQDAGQFSVFTAKPGVVRGCHYHQTKNERFIVVKGMARFRFINILNDHLVEKIVSGDKIEVVKTVPGWAHEVKNIGDDELIVLLWANEVFDQYKPDTFSYTEGFKDE